MRVRKAGVVGAGTMGAAIAELLAYNGVEVSLKDADLALAERGVERVRTIAEELVRFHAERADREAERIHSLGLTLEPGQLESLRARLSPKVTRARGDEILALVHATSEWSAFADADLVIEAVPERLELKRRVFEELDHAAGDGAVLGSNTSSLSITRIARGLRHADSCIVTHFFNPPYTLPLVEVAAGVETREDVIEGVLEYLQELRNHRYPMVPIRVREAPAFVVNRLLIPVLNEACFVHEEGVASMRDIDLAMKTGAGMPMGPFELADLIGLDVALEVAETMHRESGDPKYRAARTLKRLVDAGHLGRKTGRGFYEYA